MNKYLNNVFYQLKKYYNYFLKSIIILIDFWNYLNYTIYTNNLN